ncbi:hypothetical protein ABDK00_003065 [Niabella insulamsoli]|uniref:hypothetical protein n=1 Tax=Niabella insulamsoli TaxID=3144874 RepID=UPI0031FD3BB7
MKFYLFILTTCLVVTATSCTAQLVKTTNDASILMERKNDFVGQRFSRLLKEIKPEVKFAFGEPDTKWSETASGTYIKFFFVNGVEYRKALAKGLKPVGILVEFMLDSQNNKKAIPQGGANLSKKDLIKEYGDMIIRNIFVTGKD